MASVTCHLSLLILHFSLCSSSITAAESDFPPEQIDFFEKQVRPVLAAHCWNCHAAKKAESGLRLDSREAVLKGGDRGEVVKPREASASLLIHAVKRDGELQMPPNGKLSPEQVAALTKWIDLGLPWPRESSGSALSQAWRSHWAFQPVTKPGVPHIADDSSSQSPIDRFVLERLRAANSTAAPRADRRTLIRRVTFDLIGLPPTPDEVAEFETNPAPDAFDRLVDRLLASPKYGERWGRHWLDVARYSDTKGYVFFEEKSYPWAYTYRDYVIRSLNEDKPYDQFVVEQLAADLLVRSEAGLERDKGTRRQGDKGQEEETYARSPLPLSPAPLVPVSSPNTSQPPSTELAALGFLTVGSHFMGNVHDIVDDRIDVVTRGVMGLTVTCARCHDHKYDPIPTADYYSLYGVFRSSTEPLVPPLFSPPDDTPEYRRFSIELALRQQQLDDFVKQKHSALVEGARTRVGEYLLATKAANDKPATDDFMLIADPGDLNPAMIVRWQAYLNKVEGRGVRVEDEGKQGATTSHPVWGPWFELASLPEERFKSEAASMCGRLVLGSSSSRRVATVVPSPPSSGERARVRGPNGDDAPSVSKVQLQKSPPVGTSLDSTALPHPNPLPPKSGGEGTRRINGLVVKAVCGERTPASLSEVATRYGELMKSIHVKWQAALREAVILKRPAPERFADPDEEELRLELYGETAPASVPLIFGWGFLSLLPDRASQGEYQKVLKEVEQWLIRGPGAPPRAMVLLDGESYDPRVFVRGNPNRLGDAVPRQFLSALERDNRQPFRHGSGRLELARAIVDPKNPLTARVMVNRAWQHHFGAGLVRTPGDFGMRSDPPTHPELLDWLAAEFMNGGARREESTRGQGDKGTRGTKGELTSLPISPVPPLPKSSSTWSLKRLHRLILSSRVYQQSSQPPGGLDADPDNRGLSHANRRRLDFEATRDALLFVTGRLDDRLGGPSVSMLDGGFQPRRTLYAFLDRLDPPGLLSVFDFPSPAATSASRDTTTVSPQALFLMNGPFTATAAGLVTQRPDVTRESDTLPRLRQLTRILFAREPKGTEEGLATEFLGAQPAPAAWQQFVHALLLTNEFVFVD